MKPAQHGSESVIAVGHRVVHGMQHTPYLMEELARLGDPTASNGRVILAHLGNGASMAAVRDGKSIDSSHAK